MDSFINELLLVMPNCEEEYSELMSNYYEGLEIIAIEDILMPEIIKLLIFDKKSELKKVFDLIEKILKGDDDCLKNIIEVTILEILGNDNCVLKKAEKYMGETTKILQKQADIDIGRMKGLQ